MITNDYQQQSRFNLRVIGDDGTSAHTSEVSTKERRLRTDGEESNLSERMGQNENTTACTIECLR